MRVYVGGLCSLYAVLLISLLCALPVFAFAQGDASGSILSARQQLIVCFDSARAAEAAGANVSSLTVVLNRAGEFLSQAEWANSRGEFAAAEGFALQGVQALSGLVAEANRLRDAAAQNGVFDFWINVVASGIGAILTVVAGFLVWNFIKKKFVPVEAEGEAESDESSTK